MEVAPSELGLSFDQQYKKRERFRSLEGSVDITDISPHEITNPVPIFLVPGWSENASTYEKSLRTIYEEKRRAVTVGNFKRGGELKQGEETPEIEVLKAQLLLDTLSHKGFEKVDTIAHSEGAINVLLAAMLDPTHFRNIVLDKPAGFIGLDTKAKLMGRFVKLMIQEAVLRPKSVTDPTGALRAGLRTAQYCAANPKRVIEELDVLTSYDIADLIDVLKDNGVMISVIGGVDDPLFPVSRQIDNSGSLEHRQLRAIILLSEVTMSYQYILKNILHWL